MALPPNLNQHLLGHTFARQGYIWAQQAIEVSEVARIDGCIDAQPALSANVTVTPVLSANVYLEEED